MKLTRRQFFGATSGAAAIGALTGRAAAAQPASANKARQVASAGCTARAYRTLPDRAGDEGGLTGPQAAPLCAPSARATEAACQD